MSVHARGTQVMVPVRRTLHVLHSRQHVPLYTPTRSGESIAVCRIASCPGPGVAELMSAPGARLDAQRVPRRQALRCCLRSEAAPTCPIAGASPAMPPG